MLYKFFIPSREWTVYSESLFVVDLGVTGQFKYSKLNLKLKYLSKKDSDKCGQMIYKTRPNLIHTTIPPSCRIRK